MNYLFFYISRNSIYLCLLLPENSQFKNHYLTSHIFQGLLFRNFSHMSSYFKYEHAEFTQILHCFGFSNRYCFILYDLNNYLCI